MKLASGEFDAVIAESGQFHFFEDSGLLADLEAVSGGKLSDIGEDRLVRCEGAREGTVPSDTESPDMEPSDTEPYISGIRLEGNVFYAACTKFMDDPVLGIILSTDDQEEERVILECAY